MHSAPFRRPVVRLYLLLPVLALLLAALLMLDARHVAAAAPSTPTFSVSAGDGRFTVSWSEVTGAGQYEIQFKKSTDAWSAADILVDRVSPVTVTTSIDANLNRTAIQNGVTYDVRIKACSGARGQPVGDCSPWAVKQVTPSGPVSLGRAGSMSVDGFHPMGPGRMKIAEGASLTYGIIIHQPPTADLTITPRHHNTHVDTSRLTIHNAVTWKAAPHPNYLSGDWQRSKSVRLTAVDDNECKSPPGTRYWIRHHGSGGGPDWGGWDRQDRHHGLVISIEIIDDDCTYLAAATGQVVADEGGSATYTVRLKEPLEDAAYISPRISVPGDSNIDAITVSPERIRVEAGDTSPQTFTVSAGKDADSRNEVLIVDHSVDSPEVPADYLGARVTVIVVDEQNTAGKQERDSLSVTGLALTAGTEAVALSPAFSTNVLSYRAEVPAGTTSVTLAPHWSGGESVHAGSRNGGTSYTRPTRVQPSGTAVDLALAPDGGATELYVMVSGSGGMTTYSINVTEAGPEPKTITVPDDGTPEQQQQQTAETVETPGPVVNLQLTVKGKKVTVNWDAPTSGDAPTRYIAHLKPADGGTGKTHRPQAGKTTTTFRNLEPGVTYKVWVRAQNEAGKGERVHGSITLPE